MKPARQDNARIACLTRLPRKCGCGLIPHCGSVRQLRSGGQINRALRYSMIMRWLTAVVAGLIVTAPAFGHAKLRGSLPAADAQLQAAPKSLTLTFNETVRLAVLTLSIDGKDIPVTIDRNAPAAAQVTVTLPALAPGSYQVRWSALSVDDGHVTQGTFTFSVLIPARPSASS